MWKTTIYAQGVAVDDGLRAHIEKQMRDALGRMERRVQLVHVRLYAGLGETDLHTCYIRVEGLPNGSIALGDTAEGVGGAVTRAAARIGAAVGERSRKVAVGLELRAESARSSETEMTRRQAHV